MGVATLRAPAAHNFQRGQGINRKGEKGRGIRAHSPRGLRESSLDSQPGWSGLVWPTKGHAPSLLRAPFRSPPQGKIRFS
jgi:hypothetical protein